MSWYATVFNYTLQQHSVDQYEYGRAPVDEIVRANPKWSQEHTIVGGGHGEFILLSGWKTNYLRHVDDVHADYELEKIENPDVEECSCGHLLNHGIVIASKSGSYYISCDYEQVHCPDCHNVWDGNAQCMC